MVVVKSQIWVRSVCEYMCVTVYLCIRVNNSKSQNKLKTANQGTYRSKVAMSDCPLSEKIRQRKHWDTAAR